MTWVANSLEKRSAALLPSRDAPFRLQTAYEGWRHGCREALILQWDEGHLWFRANPDDDTLEVKFHEANFAPTAEFQASSSPLWANYIGREFGWSWSAINQQGYRDSVLLSFDGIIPNLLLYVIGSSIQVFTIARAE